MEKAISRLAFAEDLTHSAFNSERGLAIVMKRNIKWVLVKELVISINDKGSRKLFFTFKAKLHPISIHCTIKRPSKLRLLLYQRKNTLSHEQRSKCVSRLMESGMNDDIIMY
mmetsp:Transcript_12728/g.18712  ORF Transcript_12728/g.18712 Transcript_12728/m.18712 type:complete len:112 (-) Transcript_12728:1986-2321(-)